MTFYCYNQTASPDYDARLQRMQSVVTKAGADQVTDWATLGTIEELAQKVRENAGETFLLFIHNRDCNLASLFTAFGAEGWPANCYAIFYSGGGVYDQETTNTHVKFLNVPFPLEVGETSFHFKQLVAAVEAVATTVGASGTFEDIDINNPPHAEVLRTWLALDILIQGAIELVAREKSIPADWFADVQPELAKLGTGVPCDPGKKSQVQHYLSQNDCRFENLLDAVRENKLISADLLTNHALSAAHETFKQIADYLCCE